MHRLTLPGIFWRDHYDRCSDHDGERREVKDNGRTVTVELDDESLADLKNDAEYYGDPTGWEREFAPIIRSAQATLRAIAKQKPDWQSPWDQRKASVMRYRRARRLLEEQKQKQEGIDTMRVILIEGDPKFTLPGWHRVLDDSGQSLAFFRHAAEADAFLLHHGYANRLTKGRQMGAMLTDYRAVSFNIADMIARGINGYTGTRQDQQQHSKAVTFMFDDGSEFIFNPE